MRAKLVGERFDVVDDVGDLFVGEIVVRHHNGVADALLLVGILDRLNEIVAVNDARLATLEGDGLADDALPGGARAATEVGTMARCAPRLLRDLQTPFGRRRQIDGQRLSRCAARNCQGGDNDEQLAHAPRLLSPQ